MQLILPTHLEGAFTPEEALEGMALGLYVSGKLGFGRAAEVAGMPRLAFQQLIARQRVPMDYGLEDLHEDAASIRPDG